MERRIPKKCITVKQASDLTGLAPKTIQNKVYSGDLKRYGTRGKITLDLEEIQAKLIFGHPDHEQESA